VPHGCTVSNFPVHATGLQNPLATPVATGFGLATNRRQSIVARKPKIEQANPAAPASPETTASATNGALAAKSKAKAASAGKKKPPQKKKAQPAAKPATSTKTSLPTKSPGPSDEEIRIRAYFIAERRLQLSLPGDSAHDWIEAKRQLIEEAGRTL
jgi:hypothetical protein